MIVIAALMKYVNVIPQETQNGAKQLYKFISGNFTFPLMAGLGLLYIPLKDVVATLSLPYFIVVISCLYCRFSRFLCLSFLEHASCRSCYYFILSKWHGRDRRCCHPEYSKSDELDAICPSCYSTRWGNYSHYHDRYLTNDF